MTYATVCSGIEAPSVAWLPLGWRPIWYAENDAFPSAVLAHHYPETPNFGDITTTQFQDDYRNSQSPDLILGGTPCEDFSIAGKRAGMDGNRGQLALRFLAVLADLQPRWIVWENVPGVLSSAAGRDFQAFLQGLAKVGYSLAWRVLDAQDFGVPQHRERVFVVGHLGARWQSAAAVLFDSQSLHGYPSSCRQAWQEVAGADQSGFVERRITGTMTAKWQTGCSGPSGHEYDNLVTGTVCANGRGAGYPTADSAASGLLVPANTGIRRLMPLECERLMGFPDGYTDIPFRGKQAKDAPRYRALGKSIVPAVLEWVGERIEFVDNLYLLK